MANSLKKRGQKIIRKFSRLSIKAGEESKEHIKENILERVSHIENIRLLILEWGLLIVGLIMLASAQAFWFGDSYAENAFVRGGTYIEATLGDVKSLNPLFATTSSEKTLSKLLFATISTVDYSGHVNIGLAKSITPSENGKKWTVKLRDDIKWSDGEPITNEDVIFTANLIKNPAVSSVYNANLSNVKVSENENHEIVFELPAVYADFASALNIPIVPKHVLQDVNPQTLIESNFSNSPVSSGAFSLNAIQATSSTDETVVYLSANPYYYQSQPMLNSFAVHTYKDIDSIINAINNGAVTATAELSSAESSKINLGVFNQKESSLSSGSFIFFNLKHDILKNKELRFAIRQGINLAEIRSAAPETLSLDYPLVKSQININTYPSIPERNFEAAVAKVAELSTEAPISLELVTVNTGYLPEVANKVKSSLEELGMTINLITYDENQDFINNVIAKRNYDILIYEIELGADPDLLPYYHSSQASTTGLNLSNYRNSLVDDLLLGARDTLDEQLRIKKYESFLEYWVDDIPAIGLYQPNLTYYYNHNVRTFSDNIHLVTALDRFSDVTNWAATKGTKNKTP